MNFLDIRKRSYLISGILAFLCTILVIYVSFAPQHLRLGIDVTGGVQIEYETDNTIPQRSDLDILASTYKEMFSSENNVDMSELLIYGLQTSNSIRIEALIRSESDEESQKKYALLREQFPQFIQENGLSVEENSYTLIGSSLGKYVQLSARFTLILSIIVIGIYVAIAFRGAIVGMSSMTFGLITLITLVHDVLLAGGLYILLGFIFPVFTIDTFFVTALLTILGYSINDTIVILDRVRSAHMDPKKKKQSEKEKTQYAIASSVRRSLFTSLTLVLVLMPMFLFGPVSLQGFVLLLLFGTIIGTYSSIFLAAPMVYDINKNKKQK